MERSKTLAVVNEVCEMKNCNKALMFEGRKKRDLYLWMANIPNGPSVKFLVENIHTMAELKMTGNCLRGSRPLLSFDPTFNDKPQYSLLKELLSQIFGVPKHHPKSQPFFDHVYTFSILDNRIWFRNFQILSEDGALAEVGPRFVLNPVKIFSGSFGGIALWENANYVSPAKYRAQILKTANVKYINRVEHKAYVEANQPENAYELTPLNDIFEGNPLEKAREIARSDDDDDEGGEENIVEDVQVRKLGKKKTNKFKQQKSKKQKKVISKKIKKIRT